MNTPSPQPSVFRKVVSSLLSLSMLLSGVPVRAQETESFSIRVPVSTAEHPVTVTSFDFGSVVQGSVPSQVFTFTNRSSKPTVLSGVTPAGQAVLQSHTCAGTLAPWATCQLTIGVNAVTLGSNTGTVSVTHSQASAADVYSLSATAVELSNLLSFDDVTVNFGKVTIRTEGALRSLRLRNTGEEPVSVEDVRLARNVSAFRVEEHRCAIIEPGQSCDVQVRFAPSALGSFSVGLQVVLEDGSRMPGSTLNGQGVQGYPQWSVESLNFDGAVAGEELIRPVTLTNIGAGELFIKDFSILSTTGESGFSVKSTTCGAQLLPQQSCVLTMAFLSESTALQGGYLELQAEGTLMPVSRLKLFAQPERQESSLSVTPNPVNFGEAALGGKKTMEVVVRSTGQKSVSVTGYTLSGANAADFRVVNASACTGTLSPGMECALELEVTPSAAGPRLASMTLQHNATVPLAPVPLSAQGTAGTLTLTPSVLNFPSTDLGQSATGKLRLTNTGTVPVSVGAITKAGDASFTMTGLCANKPLAAGAICEETVTYSPTAAGNHTGTVSVTSNAAQPNLSSTLNGTAAAAPVPVPQLSDFTCPSPGQAPNVVCRATLSNVGTVAFAVSGPGTTNTSRAVPQLLNCTSPLATFAPGATCEVVITNSFTTTPASLSVSYSVTASGKALTKTYTVSADVPRLTLNTLPHGTVTVGQVNTATHSVTNTGSFDVSLGATPFTVSGTNAADFKVVSHTCGTTVAKNAACSVTTECRPAAVGARTATLTATPTLGAAATGALTCSAEAAPLPLNVTGPASVVMGTYPAPAPLTGPQGYAVTWEQFQTSYSASLFPAVGTVTLTNNNALAPKISQMVLEGPHASEFKLLPLVNPPASTQSCRVGTGLGTVRTCSAVVLPLPQGNGVRTATLKVFFEGYSAPVSIALQATGAESEVTVLPSTMHIPNATVGSTYSGSVALRNDGSLAVMYPLTVPVPMTLDSATTDAGFTAAGMSGVVTVSGVANTIPATKSATATFNVRATRTGAISGTATFSYYVTSSNMRLNRTVTIPLSAASAVPLAPEARLTTTDHGSTAVGVARTVSHTLTNVGTAPLNFTGATWGISPTQYKIVSNTCSSTALAVGASCTISTSCTPTVAGAVSGTLSMTSGSNLTVRPSATLSCTGTAPAASAANLVVSPTPYDFGVVKVGTTSAARSFTLTNNNPAGSAPVSVSSLTTTNSVISGTTGGLAVGTNTCTTLNPGQSCTFTVTASPTGEGIFTGIIVVQSSATGTPPTPNLTVTGRKAVFTVSPSSLPLGNGTAGQSVLTGTVTVRNSGEVPGTLVQGGRLGTGTPGLTISGTCTDNMVLAAGASCTRTVTVPTTVPAGTVSQTLSFTFDNGQTAVSVPVTATLSAAPVPLGKLDLTCPPSVTVNSPATCSVRLTSVGQATFLVYDASGTARVIPQVTVRGGSAVASSASRNSCVGAVLRTGYVELPPGAYCTYNVQFTPLSESTYDIVVNAPVSPAVSASTTAYGPDLRIQLSPIPPIQVGSSLATAHTLFNLGQGSVTVNYATSSATQVMVSASGCSTLGSGQSCTFYTTCAPASTAAVTSTITLGNASVVAHRTSATVTCLGEAPKVSINYEAPLLTRTGGYTTSGTWVRVSNNGVGAVTLTSFNSATGRTLTSPAASAGGCVVGSSLAAGASCLVLDSLGNQAPGILVEGTHRLRINNSQDITWAATPVQTLGLKVTALTAWPTQTQHRAVLTNTLRVTNEAPQALALTPTFTLTSGMTVSSHNCPANLASGASCDVQVTYTVPASGSGVTLTATVNSAYFPLVGGQLVTGATPAARPLGSWSHGLTLVAPRVVLETTTNSPLVPGQTAVLTQTLRNEGVAPVSVTGAPRLSTTTAIFVIESTTCTVGKVLDVGQTCTVSTRFTPAAFTTYTSVLTVPTSVSSPNVTLTGAMVQSTDVSATLSSPTTLQAGSVGVHTLTVRNSGTKPAEVRLNMGMSNSGTSGALTGLRAGVCGAWTFIGGSSTMTSSPVATSTVTCSPGSNPRTATLYMSAGATATLTFDFSAGNTAGTLNTSATASVVTAGMVDSAPANNTAVTKTTVTYPSVDIAITSTTLPVGVPTGRTGEFTVTVRNLATNSSLPVVSVSPSIENVQGFSFGTPVCTPYAGATCPGLLPSGGSMVFKVPYTVTGGQGTQVRVTFASNQTSTTTSDPVSGNNSVTITANARQPLYAKQCYFATDRTTDAAGTIGSPGYYANHIGADKWIRQHLADVVVADWKTGALTIGAYRMYNADTGLLDGPKTSYAIKGTNIGMMAAVGVINFRTNGGWGAVPAGYGTPQRCLYQGNDTSLVHRYCNGSGASFGYFIWKGQGYSRYETMFGSTTTGGTAYSRAPGSQLVGIAPSDVNDMYYLMWGEFSPSPTCQVPGSSTYWSQAQ